MLSRPAAVVNWRRPAIVYVGCVAGSVPGSTTVSPSVRTFREVGRVTYRKAPFICFELML
jgi:hypothetical protein